jgi:FlaA1/EpsC-like NDP-sugar epimerase
MAGIVGYRIAEIIIQMMAKKSSTIFTAVRFGNVLGSNGQCGAPF